MTLELQNITYTYQNEPKPIIESLNLSIQQGEFVSLIGKSGSGKSTLLKLITGLLKPDSGETNLSGRSIQRGDVAYMPQQDLLLPWRTVLQNIMLSKEIQKTSTLTEEEAHLWLKRAGLEKYANMRPKHLSGGMRQRVSFLRALLTGKDVILLDEPFGALDSITKKEMQAWLLSIWNESQKTILFITHDLEEACYLSDRILILNPKKELQEIHVPFGRPREPEILYSNEFITLRRKLEKKITHEAN